MEEGDKLTLVVGKKEGVEISKLRQSEIYAFEMNDKSM
jgi:hypothetical protein